MKVATIVGARPQFIKAAPVSRALASANLQEYLIHTGQHYDESMSNIFFNELNIPKPQINLGIGSLAPAEQVGKMVSAIYGVLESERPDWVIIFGDTNSTLAGALAANKSNLPLAHIESGLRSYNRAMPEETNRLISDHLSDILFTPTDIATKNLERERINPANIHQVGDVMYDAVLFYTQLAKHEPTLFDQSNLTSEPYIFVTIHRAENTDEQGRLDAIWEGINLLAKSIRVIWPLHPRTRRSLSANQLATHSPNLQVIAPTSYLQTMLLEKNAQMIVTDSGGVQKEAFFHRVPCITLREQTEWLELVQTGWNKLIPPVNSKVIFQGILEAMDKGLVDTVNNVDIFGNGHAAEKIVATLQLS